MANRESFPSSLFPLRGDVSAEAGAVTARVIGLQTVAISATAPVDTNALVLLDGVWTPYTLDGSILVDGAPVSDDYNFFCNGVDCLVGD